jgi:hypothetical protein
LGRVNRRIIKSQKGKSVSVNAGKNAPVYIERFLYSRHSKLQEGNKEGGDKKETGFNGPG